MGEQVMTGSDQERRRREHRKMEEMKEGRVIKGSRGGGGGEEAERRGRHVDCLLELEVFVSEPLRIRLPVTHHISSPFNWTVTPRTIRPQAGGRDASPLDRRPAALSHAVLTVHHGQIHE